MPKKKSLVKFAQDAGFNNVHDTEGVISVMPGSVMSDRYEILYYRLNDDRLHKPTDKPDTFRVIIHGTAMIFGIVDPYDWKSCALYRVGRKELEESEGRGGVDIDRETPLYSGMNAVNRMRALAR